jgi:hypothetical protein
MEGEKLLVSERQLHQWRILGLIEVGKIALKEAGEKVDVSYRQAKSLWRAVQVKETSLKTLLTYMPFSILLDPARFLLFHMLCPKLSPQILLLSNQMTCETF